MMTSGLALSTAGLPANAGKEITIIHTGDFHGHLIPRANVRSDSVGRMEGGLARIATQIRKIRKEEDHVLYVHTGDTIQGSAEVLYTRGQAIVDILNTFRIDAFAPGNWEFVYGTERFLELAAGPTDGYVVQVRPEQVVEIAFDGVQTSSRYPGGMALRFARVLRYRDDKGAAEADTVNTVRELHERGN